MAQNSAIEWTHHTANFWWGCFKVSDGCKNCYADTLAKRYGKSIWGPVETTDRELKKGIWKDILKWDKQAGIEGVRRRVFVQSMADFLEDHPQVYPWREQAKEIILNLKNLDVLLLTKRPENAKRFLADWMAQDAYGWPSHIWMGVSVENQEMANKRIPELLKIPAHIRFLSCEPLLGMINLELIDGVFFDGGMPFDWQRITPGIDWVIVGGESGPKARSMYPQWAMSLKNQCEAAGVAFFFKQWGEFKPIDDTALVRVGKKAAGRLLEGREWNEFPT